MRKLETPIMLLVNIECYNIKFIFYQKIQTVEVIDLSKLRLRKNNIYIFIRREMEARQLENQSRQSQCSL